MSSGVHLSNMIGSLVPGINISSSRFAIEQSGISVSDGIFLSSLSCVARYIHSRIPERALESCHLPPSMMIRFGRLFSRIHSRVRRTITSRCEAKSLIIPSWRVLILYFLYRFGSGLPFTITTRLA